MQSLSSNYNTGNGLAIIEMISIFLQLKFEINDFILPLTW